MPRRPTTPRVLLQACEGDSSQLWQKVDLGNGGVGLLNVQSGRCLDSPNGRFPHPRYRARPCRFLTARAPVSPGASTRSGTSTHDAQNGACPPAGGQPTQSCYTASSASTSRLRRHPRRRRSHRHLVPAHLRPPRDLGQRRGPASLVGNRIPGNSPSLTARSNGKVWRSSLAVGEACSRRAQRRSGRTAAARPRVERGPRADTSPTPWKRAILSFPEGQPTGLTPTGASIDGGCFNGCLYRSTMSSCAAWHLSTRKAWWLR